MTVIQLVGSLAFLLYGMNMMSDGIQKSAGQKLQKALDFMTGNRIAGFLTGLILTMIIQSSGATTAMEVSFVNAGLMTVQQSVGVTLGANIGTTITAWIVAIFGFHFNIESFAIPIFGLGFILTQIKKIQHKSIGEAIMGFGLLFIGLNWLSKTISPESGTLNFLQGLSNYGALSIFFGVIAGALLTALIHSSSALTAIVITMAFNHLVTWKFAASLVIGSNIGSTIDAVLASLKANADAKRTAAVHFLFNVATVILALIFLDPLLELIDLITPGTPEENITYHISMLHTVLKSITSIICLPFTKQIALFVGKLIKSDKDETPNIYKLEFIAPTNSKENAAPYLMRVESEINKMTLLVTKMFENVSEGFTDRSDNFIANYMEVLEKDEDYADQMKELLTKYLINCSHLHINDTQANNITVMQQIIDDLEEMTDDCYNVALLLKKSIEKNMKFSNEDMDRFGPYIDLARQFMYFIRDNINKPMDNAKLLIAREIEGQIDVFRKNLKKTARKRLEAGADVKTELLYIDLVRQIEKFGDRAYNIASALSQN